MTGRYDEFAIGLAAGLGIAMVLFGFIVAGGEVAVEGASALSVGLAIIILGFVLSVAAGVGLAALVDGLDGTVRGRGDLEAMLGAAPLVSVPFVTTFQDRRKLWIRRASAASAVAISLILVFVWT